MSWEYDFNLIKADIDWLIDQAEQVEKAFKEGWNARVNDGGKLPNSSNDDERSY